MVLQPGDYVLRFRTYQEQTGLAVPEGSGTVSWSDDGYAPAPPTTTTSTTTSPPATTTTPAEFSPAARDGDRVTSLAQTQTPRNG